MSEAAIGCFERYFDTLKANAESPTLNTKHTPEVNNKEYTSILNRNTKSENNQRINRSMDDYTKFVSKSKTKKTPQELIIDIQKESNVSTDVYYKTPEAKRDRYRRQNDTTRFVSINSTPRQHLTNHKDTKERRLLKLYNRTINISIKANSELNIIKLPEVIVEKQKVTKVKTPLKKLKIKRYTTNNNESSVTPKEMLDKLKKHKQHIYNYSDIPKLIPLVV